MKGAVFTHHPLKKKQGVALLPLPQVHHLRGPIPTGWPILEGYTYAPTTPSHDRRSAVRPPQTHPQREPGSFDNIKTTSKMATASARGLQLVVTQQADRSSPLTNFSDALECSNLSSISTTYMTHFPPAHHTHSQAIKDTQLDWTEFTSPLTR